MEQKGWDESENDCKNYGERRRGGVRPLRMPKRHVLDQRLRLQPKRRAYVAEFRTKVEECLAANDWKGVVELYDGTTVSEASDVAFAKDARVRAKNGRVAEVRAETEKLFKNDDWKALFVLTRNENDTRMSELRAWAEARREREILN